MGSDRRARRGLRALAIVVVTLALTTAFTGTAGAAPPTNLVRAQRGAQWLANQIRHNGGFVRNFGKPDPVDTAYAVIGMRAVGVDKGASNTAIRYLKTKIGKQLQLSGHDSPGALAEYILASVANAQDPHHFGGTAPMNNLVDRLLATARTSGPDKGLFGASDPTFDGAFRQGLALAALKLVHIPATDPRVVAGIAWLTKQQCANGLWEAYRAKTSTPCPRANASTFTGPDTNSTSLAVQGLAAWGAFPGKHTLLTNLRQVQSSDAGWPFVAAKNQASDPDSTALVIQALVAERSAPSSSTWAKGAHSPFTALASYQIGCTSSDYGAFFFAGSTKANTFATAQAVPAMAGKSFPVSLSNSSKTLGLTRC